MPLAAVAVPWAPPGAPRAKPARAYEPAEWFECVRATRRLAADYGAPLAGAQIFLCGPVGYSPLLSGPSCFQALRAAAAPGELAEPPFRYLVHSHYMSATAWDLQRARQADLLSLPELDAGQRQVAGARKHLAGQLRACGAFGGEGVVVHLPSLPPAELAACVADVVGRRAGPPAARLWLETSAEIPRTGWGYHTASQIRQLCAALDDRSLFGPGGAGLCPDTAHLWAQGVDAVRDYDATLELFRPAQELLDFPLPFMAHLNDCGLPLGAGRDTHLPVGEGLIWSGAQLARTGAFAVVELCRELDGLAVLERGRADHLVADFLNLAPLCS